MLPVTHVVQAIIVGGVLAFLTANIIMNAVVKAMTTTVNLSQARVHLAQGDPSAALAVLSPWREQVEARRWEDERLKVLVLEALALEAHGDKDQAVHLLLDTLALAEPGGFIRLFVDEGRAMAHLLSQAEASSMMPDYMGKLLAIFEAKELKSENTSYSPPPAQPLITVLPIILLHCFSMPTRRRKYTPCILLSSTSPQQIRRAGGPPGTPADCQHQKSQLHEKSYPSNDQEQVSKKEAKATGNEGWDFQCAEK